MASRARRILGLLDKCGLRVPGATPFSKGNIAWLRGLGLGFMDARADKTRSEAETA